MRKNSGAKNPEPRVLDNLWLGSSSVLLSTAEDEIGSVMNQDQRIKWITKNVPYSKAVRVMLFDRLINKQHKDWLAFWQAKNNSKEKRISWSKDQITKAFNLDGSKKDWSLIALMKNEWQNLGLGVVYKLWNPLKGKTTTRLADEFEITNPEQEIREKENDSLLSNRFCSVVRSVVNELFPSNIDPGVLDLMVQRSRGLELATQSNSR